MCVLVTSFYLVIKHNMIGTGGRDESKIGCRPPGNPNCNPNTWSKYSNGCCSEEEKCTIGEGDCNSDNECHGSLVCTSNSCPSSEYESRKFHPRAKCCQQPSGALILGIK